MKKKTGKKFIPFAQCLLDEKESKAVADVLASGWVTQGPKVLQFEKLVKDYVGMKEAVATTSATTALSLALAVTGVGNGDEVLVPSFTFIATANVIVHAGAIPVFVDIDPQTYNLDPKDLEEKITKKTKAILSVDQVGLACDMAKIAAIAKRYNLRTIEDAAPSLGSFYQGLHVGHFADVTCFSFHPRKVVTTGEGGMLVTNNPEYAHTARLLRHHGMSISDRQRHNARTIVHESYDIIGFNYRMSDLCAAVGIVQMKKLRSFLKSRAKVAHNYSQALKGNPHIQIPYVPIDTRPNWQSYIVRLQKNAVLSRDKLMQKLLDDGIATRRGVMAIHREKPYSKRFGKTKLPNTDEATDWTIGLPIYPQLSLDDQTYIIERILYHTKRL